MDSAAAIRATIGPWTKAALNRDWDTLLAMCTDDIVFAPPGEPMVPAGGTRAWLEAFPVMKQFNFAFERIEADGDLATGVGSGSFTIEINGQDVAMPFKFADVFRRGRDGTWRYAHVIWNLNIPNP